MTEAERRRRIRESEKRSDKLLVKMMQCQKDMDRKLKEILRVI